MGGSVAKLLNFLRYIPRRLQRTESHPQKDTSARHYRVQLNRRVSETHNISIPHPLVAGKFISCIGGRATRHNHYRITSLQ